MTTMTTPHPCQSQARFGGNCSPPPRWACLRSGWALVPKALSAPFVQGTDGLQARFAMVVAA